MTLEEKRAKAISFMKSNNIILSFGSVMVYTNNVSDTGKIDAKSAEVELDATLVFPKLEQNKHLTFS
jgi:hypothetical protein